MRGLRRFGLANDARNLADSLPGGEDMQTDLIPKGPELILTGGGILDSG